jgi:hypothetical protein
MTGDTHYRDIALKVGRFIASLQARDGSFLMPLGAQSSAEHAYVPQDLDLTAEFTLWLGLIASHIMARDAETPPAA